jgi:Uma2 family endonuclease
VSYIPVMHAHPPEHVEEGPFTWDDFVELPDDDRRELIDGWLVEVEVPNVKHEFAVAVLIGLLWAWARPRGWRVLASGYKVRVSQKRGIMPDVQLFRPDNEAPLRQIAALVAGRPDVVIEVASPSRRRFDRVTKLDYYRRIGVPEYWLVDPAERTLERLALRDGRYVVADALSEGALLRPAEHEGLELPLGELWMPEP